MAVLFDTLKLADRLEAAGMPPRQAHDTAEAFADTLTGTVATSADVAAVRGEVRESELRLRNEIAAGDASLLAEIKDLRAELIKWLVGTGIAAVLALTGIFTALLKLLH